MLIKNKPHCIIRFAKFKCTVEMYNESAIDTYSQSPCVPEYVPLSSHFFTMYEEHFWKLKSGEFGGQVSKQNHPWLMKTNTSRT